MASFSERYGYKPDRSQLHQLEGVDDRLRNAVWNFLLDRFFPEKNARLAYEAARSVWVEVAGGRADELPSLEFSFVESIPARDAVSNVRNWLLKATWNEVYDVLEHLLRKHPTNSNTSEANSILSREGSAYRFSGGWMVPVTSEEELESVESATNLPDPFHGASQHITQAVAHLSDRSRPDFRNAIKESISAVETAVGVAVGVPGIDIERGLEKLDLHNQLRQAWKNMFNWTSDEDGVRHGSKGAPQVGLSEARYMVVASSAFVNYLVVKSTEGNAD